MSALYKHGKLSCDSCKLTIYLLAVGTLMFIYTQRKLICDSCKLSLFLVCGLISLSYLYKAEVGFSEVVSNLHLNGGDVGWVDKLKYLGIYISKDRFLRWTHPGLFVNFMLRQML